MENISCNLIAHDDGKAFFENKKFILNNNVPFVLLKNIYCGICNSDIKEIQGVRISRRDFGHECVSKIFDNNIGLDNDALVTFDPHIEVDRGTFFSKYTVIEGNINNIRSALIPIPSDDLKFVLAEPVACAIHAVNRLMKVKNNYKNILVYGAGFFGYLIYLILKTYKFNVFLYNRSGERLQALEGLVGEINKESHAEENYFDAVIFTQSFVTFSDIDSCISKINNDSVLLLFGAIKKDTAFNLYEIRNNELIQPIVYKGKKFSVAGNLGANRQDFYSAITLLNDSSFGDQVKKIISEVCDLDKGLEIINKMVIGNKHFGKFVIDLTT